MATSRYVGKVLSNGRLSLPKETRERLGLEVGQEVEVTVRVRESAEMLPEEAFAPLRELIGIAKTGKQDGALHHDRYLYGKREEE